MELMGCRDFDRRPAVPQPAPNAWGAHSPAVDKVIDFLPPKSKSAEVEEQRRVAAEIKRELAAKKAAKAQAAAAALAPSAAAGEEDDLFWDYGQAAAVSAPPTEVSKPAQVRPSPGQRMPRMPIFALARGISSVITICCVLLFAHRERS